MNQELMDAINAYVLSLPDMYISPNDDSRLVRIAYEIEKSEMRLNDDFDSCFLHALSQKFERFYAKESMEDFYQVCKSKMENFVYVISKLKSMDLLK